VERSRRSSEKKTIASIAAGVICRQGAEREKIKRNKKVGEETETSCFRWKDSMIGHGWYIYINNRVYIYIYIYVYTYLLALPGRPPRWPTHLSFAPKAARLYCLFVRVLAAHTTHGGDPFPPLATSPPNPLRWLHTVINWFGVRGLRVTSCYSGYERWGCGPKSSGRRRIFVNEISDLYFYSISKAAAISVYNNMITPFFFFLFY